MMRMVMMTMMVVAISFMMVVKDCGHGDDDKISVPTSDNNYIEPAHYRDCGHSSYLAHHCELIRT